jgi:hypothetical protein
LSLTPLGDACGQQHDHERQDRVLVVTLGGLVTALVIGVTTTVSPMSASPSASPTSDQEPPLVVTPTDFALLPLEARHEPTEPVSRSA